MNRTARQRKRLQILIAEAGSHAALAEKIGSSESYISQLKTARSGIARKFCERLERAMDKQDGWLDQWLPEEVDGATTGRRLTEEEVALLDYFRRWDREGRRWILQTVKLARTASSSGPGTKK